MPNAIVVKRKKANDSHTAPEARKAKWPDRWCASSVVTRDVTMRFGGLTAVKSLEMTVPRLALYGLIGPNGAGKTTVFNVLTGVYCPTEGEIEFDGTRIEKKKPYEITRLGAARTFQNT